MAIWGQVGAYIRVAEPLARPTGGMPLHSLRAPDFPPVGRAGCPRARVRGLFANKKLLIREEALPLDGQEVSGLPPPAR
jgi:hypothetical protein